MKKFLVLLSEKQPNLLTDNLLQAHINFLKYLKNTEHLVLCGPFSNNQGAMLIIRGTSEQQVLEFMQSDPFIMEKYYQSITIHEFIEADEKNNWLMNSN